MNSDDNNFKFPLDDIPLDNMAPEGGVPVPIEATMIVEKPAVAGTTTVAKRVEAAVPANDNHQDDAKIKEIRQGLSDQPTELYRGFWTNIIKNRDKIPVGGSILSDSLTTMLTVDTSWIDEQSVNFTREKIDSSFAGKNGDQFRQLVESNGIQLNPELLHVLYQVQKKMESLMQVDRADQASRAIRNKLYLDHKDGLKLSDLVGRSECAEQAIVGKILLDKLGIKSSLMEGVLFSDDGNEEHAFLVLDDPDGENSLIFDIRRPFDGLNGFPNISRADIKVEPSIFEGKRNFSIKTTSIYDGKSTTEYGVGDAGDFVE